PGRVRVAPDLPAWGNRSWEAAGCLSILAPSGFEAREATHPKWVVKWRHAAFSFAFWHGVCTGISMRIIILGAWLGLGFFSVRAVELTARPIEVKVVVVSTFETGADTGDKPGEFQFWVEREKLDQAITVPGVTHPVLTNGKGLLGVVSGTTV